MKIAILDPSYVTNNKRSPNLGDQVISRAITREIINIFPDAKIHHFPTKSVLSDSQINNILECDYKFVAGSNLLWFRWWKYAAWKINIKMLFRLKDLIFVGVGWGDYSIKPNWFGRFVCKKILSTSAIHSFRDLYTTNIAKNALMIRDCVNTICPTMWSLTKEHCDNIPKEKSKSVLFTLTDYCKDHISDKKLVNILLANYDSINFFPQGPGDLEYLKSLNLSIKDITILPYEFEYFEDFVKNNEFDYVGTRLHAGIYCLEHYKRSFVVSIDNRATEIKITSNLPVIERDKIEKLSSVIMDTYTTDIILPNHSIDKWKSQFYDN